MWARFRNRLKFLVYRRRIDREFAEELELHRDLIAAEQHQNGASPESARRGAAIKMGNLAVAREDARDPWLFAVVESRWRDVRLSLRSLRRDASFTAVAVTVLALGLGANLAVFRFVDAIMMQELTVKAPRELVLVAPYSHSYGFFKELQAATSDVLASTAARSPVRLNVTVDGISDLVEGEIVSGEYFGVLGVRPAAGRLLSPADDGTPGANAVCVVSDLFWRTRLGGSPDAIGRFIELNAKKYQVVGVTEPGFHGSALHSRFEFQVPMSMSQEVSSVLRDSSTRWLRVFGRLKTGVGAAAAEEAIRSRFGDEKHKVEIPRDPISVTDGSQGFEYLTHTLADPVVIAQFLGLAVLLVGYASLAGLLLARGSARWHEVAVRQSLGASRRRLIGQALTEGLVVSTISGALGLAFAAFLDRALVAILFERGTNIFIDGWPSLNGWNAIVALVLLSSLAVAAVPALAAAGRVSLAGLSESRRTTVRFAWFSRALIVFQVASCLFLLFGAGLLARSLKNLGAIELGLDPTNVAVLTAGPGRAGYTRPEARAFYLEWLRRAELIPGVQSAGLASVAATSGEMYAASIEVPDAAPSHGPSANNNFNTVTPTYFDTVGIPLVAGRPFRETDNESTTQVVIVNQRFVERYWPGQSPLGRHFKAMGKDVEIVGLVRTAKYMYVREAPQITIYVPYLQAGGGQLKLHARVQGNVEHATALLAKAARDIDPKVPVFDAATLTDHVRAGFANERALGMLGTLFAGLALVVAAGGLYGTVAYAATRRRREVGVRVAIGAQRSHVVGLFLRDIGVLVAIGVMIGVPLALAAGRELASLLYGVAPGDKGILTASAAVLVLVAGLSAGLPAVRASRVDPVVALRTE